MIIGYKAVTPSCNSKTPYLRSKFLIWRTANILQQSRLLGRLNKNAVESVVDGIPCTSFQNPGSDFAFGNCHPKAHSNFTPRSFLISKTWNTAIFPYFPLKITYSPLFFTLFPQKFLDMQGKGTLFRPHKSKFRSYISQSKDDTKFLLTYICVLRCRLNTSMFRAWYCRRTTQ